MRQWVEKQSIQKKKNLNIIEVVLLGLLGENKMKVVHCKRALFDVYIGRGHGSIWGNPFKVNIDGNREEVIEKYKQYFLNKIKEDADFREKTLKLRGKILGCWCKPKACHGDVIVEWLEDEEDEKTASD